MERNRAFQRFLKRGKVAFKIYQHRLGGGFLYSDYHLGTAFGTIEDLESQCEVHKRVNVMDPKNTRKTSGAQVEFKIRLSHPIEGKDMIEKRVRWLRLEEAKEPTVMEKLVDESNSAHLRAVDKKLENVTRRKMDEKKAAQARKARPSPKSQPAARRPVKRPSASSSPSSPSKDSTIDYPPVSEMHSYEVLQAAASELNTILNPHMNEMLAGTLSPDLVALNARRGQVFKKIKKIEGSLQKDGAPNLEAMKLYVAFIERQIPKSMAEAKAQLGQGNKKRATKAAACAKIMETEVGNTKAMLAQLAASS